MKAIEITEYGAPEVLKLGERPMPEPKAGEVLIRVRAAGVNRPDVFQRTGNYPVPPGASDIPGSVSYTHLTLPTKEDECRSRWSPYH